MKYGKAVGDKIKELIQIITPRTLPAGSAAPHCVGCRHSGLGDIAPAMTGGCFMLREGRVPKASGGLRKVYSQGAA